MKKLKVTVDGKVYEVLVEIEGEVSTAAVPAAPAPVKSAPISAPAPAAAPAPKAAPAPAPAGDGTPVSAPLAGKVVSIDAKVGQSVKEGDQILTLEAMKMNTYIYANKSGKVSSITVSVGDGVEEGQTLATIA